MKRTGGEPFHLVLLLFALVTLNCFDKYPVGKTTFFPFFVIGSDYKEVGLVLIKAVNRECGVFRIFERRKSYNYRRISFHKSSALVRWSGRIRFVIDFVTQEVRIRVANPTESNAGRIAVHRQASRIIVWIRFLFL